MGWQGVVSTLVGKERSRRRLEKRGLDVGWQEEVLTWISKERSRRELARRGLDVGWQGETARHEEWSPEVKRFGVLGKAARGRDRSV